MSYISFITYEKMLILLYLLSFISYSDIFFNKSFHDSFSILENVSFSYMFLYFGTSNIYGIFLKKNNSSDFHN